MKKAISVFAFVLIAACGTAQNLVPNPSFEDTTACPNFNSQIDRASGWSSFRNTPDYFNSCNSNIVNVPSNFVGYQDALTGNSYAGFFSKSGNNYREWIGIQLLQPLIIGGRYIVSFFVNLAYKQSAQVGLATNKLGARFSTIPYPSNNQLPLDGYAHIYTDSIISDTLNWVEITGSFIADSAYQYIIIGNFSNDTLTTTFTNDTNLIHSYYFVDDITVQRSDTIHDGINDLNDENFLQIFPNPSHEWIEVLGQDITKLFIYDILGNLRYSIEPSTQIIRLNVATFSKGIYFLNAETPKRTLKQKIIIQ